MLGSAYFRSKKYANIRLIERGGTGKSEKKFVEARLLLLSDDFVAAAAAVYCWLRFLVVYSTYSPYILSQFQEMLIKS